MEYEDFKFLSDELTQLKLAVASDYHEISSELLKKESIDKRILGVNDNLEILKENFSKIILDFSFKTR